MSENWEFYNCKVDHSPAYIFFDVDIAKEIDIEKFKHMAYVRIYLLHPNEDGLSTNEEFEKLCTIEDCFANNLCLNNDTVYVGRNTSSGCRDFYFYTSTSNSWESKVKLAMKGFQDYEFELGAREDKSWHSYFNFLYPSARDWETIQSRRVCDQLSEQGDTLKAEREIDHWIYFKNPLNRQAFENKLNSFGYMLRGKSEPDGSDDNYGLQIYNVDVPSPYISLVLFDAVQQYEGEYEGWETLLITP